MSFDTFLSEFLVLLLKPEQRLGVPEIAYRDITCMIVIS